MTDPNARRPPTFPASTPLCVLVAGAGIGGITAALALRTQGHTVHVFEQSALANEVGAGIHVAPNSNRLLRRLGLNLEEDDFEGENQEFNSNHVTPYSGYREYGINGKMTIDLPMWPLEAAGGVPYYLMHRAHLHSAIKRKALKAGVQLHTASRIVKVNSQAAEVELAGGAIWKGDLLVAADGVHSLTRSSISGCENIRPFGSGRVAFRFMIPIDSIRSSESTRPYAAVEGQNHKFHAARGRQLLVYPCVGNTLMNCVAACPTKMVAEHASALDRQKGGESNGNEGKIEKEIALANRRWDHLVSKEHMLRIFADAPNPVVSEFLGLADPDSIRLWELMDMDILPTWIEGHTALLGDSAHPFTPWRGQGAGMAIEDAGVLGGLFPLGTRPEEVPSRLRLWEDQRRDRVNEIQRVSRLSGGKLDDMTVFDDELKSFDNMKFGKSLLFYDAWNVGEKALREEREKQNGSGEESKVD